MIRSSLPGLAYGSEIVADGVAAAWSPDSSSLAYARFDAARNSSGVYVRSVAGGPETDIVDVTDTRGLRDQLAWSADAKHVAVPLEIGESNRLYGLNPATGLLRQLPVEAPSYLPFALAPSGSALYDFASSRVLSLDGKRTFSTGGGGVVTDWSRDGTRMLVIGAGLSELDLGTGKRTQLLGGNVQDAVWSPDGRRVAFVRDQRLGVLDLSNNSSKVIVPNLAAMYLQAAIGAGYLAWSPDGKRIAFADWRAQEPVTQGQSDIYLVDADGAHLTRATHTPSAKRYYAFAPDGRHLAYANLGNNILDSGAARHA